MRVSLERSIRVFGFSYSFSYLILNLSEVEEHLTNKEILLFNPLGFHQLHHNWTFSLDHRCSWDTLHIIWGPITWLHFILLALGASIQCLMEGFCASHLGCSPVRFILFYHTSKFEKLGNLSSGYFKLFFSCSLEIGRTFMFSSGCTPSLSLSPSLSPSPCPCPSPSLFSLLLFAKTHKNYFILYFKKSSLLYFCTYNHGTQSQWIHL